MEGQKKKWRKRGGKVKYVKKAPKEEGSVGTADTSPAAPQVMSKPVIFQPVKSEEEEFKGTSETWFNEEEFKKQFTLPMDYKEEPDSYFGSYSHFGIHEEMLKDEVRTRSYMNACLNNKDQFKDKIVLDIGCGTGILSIFAARAGAKHVYGIDNASIVEFARNIVKSNGLQDKITIIKGKMEEIKLPVEKVDIIISEWMGYFLLFESMLDTVLYARDKYLVSDGLILPDKVSLHMVGLEDAQYRQEKFGFWENVYGVKMTSIQQVAISEPLVETVPRKLIRTNTCTFFELDLYKAKVSDLTFAYKYRLVMDKTDTIHAVACWFDADFSKLKNPVKLTTSVYTKPTHWRQTIFYLAEPINAKEGRVIEGSIAVKKSEANFRDLDIKISYHYHDEHKKVGYSQMYRLR